MVVRDEVTRPAGLCLGDGGDQRDQIAPGLGEPPGAVRRVREG